MKTIKGLQVLEEKDFNHFCPSFYATAPKSDRSERYQFINSRDIAVELWNKGWFPTYAREQRSNKAENRGFNKHLVRFSNPDFTTTDGDRIELVSVNSHNGISAYQFYCGIFRQVCTNGLIVMTSDMGRFSVLHKGDIIKQVHSNIKMIADNASMVSGSIDEMKAIELTPDEQGVFASAAHKYVYDETEKAPISADRLLYARRSYDQSPSLWATYNRVQENIIKGGIRGYNRDKRRRVTTRTITSIDKDIKLNKALWQLAEQMKEIKQAA